MKKKTESLVRVLTLGGALTLATIAQATDVGEQYVGLNFSIIDSDSTLFNNNPVEAFVELNLPTIEVEGDTGFGLDLLGRLSYFNGDENVFTPEGEFDTRSHFQGVGVRGGLRGYYKMSETMAPFVSATAGYFNLDDSDGAISWDVALGLQIGIGDALSITPSITFYSSGTELGEFPIYGVDDAFYYGLDANYWLNETLGFNAFVRYADENLTESFIFGGGVRFRY